MHTHTDSNHQIDFQEVLSKFLALNPDSSLESLPVSEHSIINRPWNDESISIIICPQDIELTKALNTLILPSSLTAIYHTDTKLFEFIFSVRPETDNLWSREFDFTYKMNTYHCHYAKSSSRLLSLAAATIPNAPLSHTDYRNLRIFHDFCNQGDLTEDQKKYFVNRNPMSFYSGPLEYAVNDTFIELLRHINFYMFYVDHDTPQIIIHNPEDTHAAIYEAGRKGQREFPNSLIATPLDSYILDLWEAAQRSTTRLEFQYYYQIIEYSAFYFLDDQIKQNLSRILRRPDIISTLDTCVPLLLEHIIEYRQTDEYKLVAVIKKSVEPSRIWDVIAQYEDFFSQPIEFDGGFSVDALIKQGWTAEDFKIAWIPKLPDTFRRIRNALVHSREQRSGQAISPTHANSIKLIPWVKLMEEVACQVAMCR